MCTGRMLPFKRISAYCKTNDNDDDDRHQLATREKKKRGVIRKTTIRQVRICRYVIPYLRSRFVGCIFIKGNGRGEERITLFVHISIHTHITTSPRSSNYGWAFRFFCFPTLSRVPHFERAGNKKREKGGWAPRILKSRGKTIRCKRGSTSFKFFKETSNYEGTNLNVYGQSVHFYRIRKLFFL